MCMMRKERFSHRSIARHAFSTDDDAMRRIRERVIHTHTHVSANVYTFLVCGRAEDVLLRIDAGYE